MLRELHIENIAIIEKADISFHSGLNVLSGETGAGKSIIIDSIGALLGNRVNHDIVRSGADKANVAGVFDFAGCEHWLEENDIDFQSDDYLIINRKISKDGKSVCKVCGQPVSTAQLKELGMLLIDIHGQNDGRQLLDEKNHISYIDSYSGLGSRLEEYKKEFSSLTALKHELEELSIDEYEKQMRIDILSSQIIELETADISEGEYDSLLEKRKLLENSEKLIDSVSSAYALLYDNPDNALSLIHNASSFISKAAHYTKSFEELSAKLSDAEFIISDISEQLSDFKDSLEFSDEDFSSIEARIQLINRLKRKYNVDADSLGKVLERLRKELSNIENNDIRIEELKYQIGVKEKSCLKLALGISQIRKEHASLLEKQITDELKCLSMPSAVFSVEITTSQDVSDLGCLGCDDVKFLMSANKGESLGRISKIASGGELSRIMLAMKNVFAVNDPVQTLVFDEIDTGVSGIAAQRVAEKLYSVSKGKQVMCVTHLPQIEAMADYSYYISKEENAGRTFTSVRLLDYEGRKAELARLHSGDNITVTTLISAAEQLASAQKYKEEHK